MMQTPRMAYQGACVFLTSNGLPALSKPSDDPGDGGYDWAAIRTRTTFFRMDVTHSGMAKFPFDATVLAHAILETSALHEPSLTQCSQPQSQPACEEKLPLPPVPEFPPDLAELLADEVFTTPQKRQAQKPSEVSSVLGKRVK